MKKIIFDLDDTLYKSEELRDAREKAILELLGERAEFYISLREKQGTIKSLSEMGISRKEFFKIMESVEINLEEDFILREILQNLKKDYTLIVLSNISKLCIEKTLKALGILALIDEVQGGDCFINPKPHEATFSVVGRGDICVGNNFAKDLLVPKTKGAITILITEKPDSRADFNIRSIYEINKIIDQLNI